jgi:hypothetical protein
MEPHEFDRLRIDPDSDPDAEGCSDFPRCAGQVKATHSRRGRLLTGEPERISLPVGLGQIWPPLLWHWHFYELHFALLLFDL